MPPPAPEETRPSALLSGLLHRITHEKVLTHVEHLGVLETEACGPLAHLNDISQLSQLPHDLVRHPLAEVVLEGPLHHSGDTREGKGTSQGPQGEVVEAED